MSDLVGQIIAFEEGELDDAGTLELFSELIKSGMAWSLQGSYGFFAAELIKGGYITPEGEITEYARELLERV
jgi:hypothetical protein